MPTPRFDLGGWTPFNQQTQQWNWDTPLPGGLVLYPHYEDLSTGQGEDYTPGPRGALTGYSIYGRDNPQPGDWIDNYDASGNFTGSEQQPENPGLISGMLSDPLFGAFLAAAGGMAAFLPGGFAAGGAGSTAGAANGMWDAAIPGSTSGAAGGAGGLGATTYGATGPSAFMQGAGITGAGTGASLTGSSALTSLAGGSGLGALSGLLGPAATLLGGLAGAQGNEQSQTQTREIPQWIKDFYVDGRGGGLLPMGMGLLQSQMSPQRTAELDQLRSNAIGLLNTPANRTYTWGGR